MSSAPEVSGLPAPVLRVDWAGAVIIAGTVQRVDVEAALKYTWVKGRVQTHNVALEGPAVQLNGRRSRHSGSSGAAAFFCVLCSPVTHDGEGGRGSSNVYWGLYARLEGENN